MRFDTEVPERFRLVVSVDGLHVVYQTAGFSSYEDAQSRVGHAVRHFTQIGGVGAVTLEVRSDDVDDWRPVRQWGKRVVDRIVDQCARRVAPAHPPVAAARVEAPHSPAPRNVAARQETRRQAAAVRQNRHKSYRWQFAATAAFVILAWLGFQLQNDFDVPKAAAAEPPKHTGVPTKPSFGASVSDVVEAPDLNLAAIPPQVSPKKHN